MLKSKRQRGNTKQTTKPKRNLFKQNPLKDRLKNISDEEIDSASDNSINELEDDDFFQKEDNPTKTKPKPQQTEIYESTDAKRNRLAKKLLNDVSAGIKTKDSAYQNIDQEVDDYLTQEIKKDQNEYFLSLTQSEKFNPKQINFIKGHRSAITAMDISSDSAKVITCSKDCRAIVYDIQTGKRNILKQFSKKGLYACVFSPDDHTAFFGGADRHIYQIDLNTHSIVHSFKAHNDTVTGLAFDTNKDQFYSISKDNTLKVWALNSERKGILLETFYGHTDKVNSIDLMSAVGKAATDSTALKVNRVITCGNDKTINLWKVDAQSFLQFKLVDELSPIDAISSINNDFFISGSFDGNLHLFRTNKKKAVYKLQASHGYEFNRDIKHSFFINQDELNTDTNYNSSNVKIAYPIISLGCIKNSDMVMSGSSDGVINFYRFSPGNISKEDNYSNKAKIEIFKKFEMSQRGCVNAIKINRNNDIAVVAISKDGRLGRWNTEKKAKNGICVIKLFD